MSYKCFWIGLLFNFYEQSAVSENENIRWKIKTIIDCLVVYYNDDLPTYLGYIIAILL